MLSNLFPTDSLELSIVENMVNEGNIVACTV
jgi:hypothetical protein